MSFSENDFPLLESKPEVDRKWKKIRRHAGAALAQKKLADKAYILKTVVNDSGVGKVQCLESFNNSSTEFFFKAKDFRLSFKCLFNTPRIMPSFYYSRSAKLAFSRNTSMSVGFKLVFHILSTENTVGTPSNSTSA